jgi:MFS family permease
VIEAQPTATGVSQVLRNRPFLLLWVSQLLTQVGANMVLYGLTVVVLKATSLSSAVSALFLTFLVPAVLLSAVAGVYVDRVDRRLVLVVTNILRAVLLVAIWAVGGNLTLILLLNVLLSTVTVFFAPAEAAMIPFLVPRGQLISANGLFTLTLNGAFALGYALFGPLIVTIASAEALILVVAVLYVIASVFCVTLPSNPPVLEDQRAGSYAHAEAPGESTLAQLREGIGYIRQNPMISWSLVYLGIAASLVGVIGVLGPSFAEKTLGLDPEDLVVVVLPLGLGIVTGILLLNQYGRYVPRRRAIEGGLIMLGILLVVLTVAGPVSRLLQGIDEAAPVVDLSVVTSLVAVVVVLAFLAGTAYGVVAISSQTQLQEDIPPEGRGRVFGVLNMLVSVSTFLPIIVVGPISDLVGTTNVILVVAVAILMVGIVSIVRRGPLRPAEQRAMAGTMVPGTAMDPIGVAMRAADADSEAGEDGPAPASDANEGAGDRAGPGEPRSPAEEGPEPGAEAGPRL